MVLENKENLARPSSVERFQTEIRYHFLLILDQNRRHFCSVFTLVLRLIRTSAGTGYSVQCTIVSKYV